MEKLPLEIFRRIATECPNRDLASLAQTCSGFKGPALEQLYLNNIRNGNSSALFWAAGHGELGTITRLLFTAVRFGINGVILQMQSDNVRDWCGICAFDEKAKMKDKMDEFEDDSHADLDKDLEDETAGRTLQYLLPSEAKSCLYEELRINLRSDWSLMHLAAFYGHESVVRFLQICGLDIEVYDAYDHTPLYYAMHGSHFARKARFLVGLGAGINHLDPNGCTMLEWACVKAESALAIRLMLSNASVHSLPSGSGENLLHDYCGQAMALIEREPHDSGKRGRLAKQLIELMMNRGLRLSLPSMTGYTPLHLASDVPETKLNYDITTDIIEALVSLGADPNSQNNTGESSVMLGLKTVEDDGKDAVERRIRAYGAGGQQINLEAKDEDGATCLVRTLLHNQFGGNLICAEVLLDHGADPRTTYQGKSLVEWVSKPRDHPYKAYWDSVKRWLRKVDGREDRITGRLN